MKRSKQKRRKQTAAHVPPPPQRRAAFVIAALSAVAFVLLALGNIRATSPTTDETVHLVAGERSLAAHDYRLSPEHPPLLKMMAAIPLRAMRVWPGEGGGFADGSKTLGLLNESWAMAVTNPMAAWYYAHHLLYGVRDTALERLGAEASSIPSTAALTPGDFLNDSATMFLRARSVMLLCGVLLAAAIFLWSMEAWGPWAAALSTLLFCFDPNFIANSGLVTTDVGTSLLIFASVWLFWRLCRAFSWPNVAAFALCFGLAQAAKFSALLLVPTVIAIALMQGRRRLPRIALAIGIAFASTYIVLWAAYGFRFSMAADPQRAASEEAAARATLTQRGLDGPVTDGHPPIRQLVEESAVRRALADEYPNGAPPAEARRARTSTPVGLLGRAIIFAAGNRLLPEAYLYGMAILLDSMTVRNSFLRGEYSTTGFSDYFLWTFLYKTPLPAIAAILLALVMAVRRGLGSREPGVGSRSRAQQPPPTPDSRSPIKPPGLLPFLLWPIAIYLFVSVRSGVNIGHRHILPIYPFLYVLCGSLASLWETMAPRRRMIVAVCAIASIVTASLFVFAGTPAPVWSRHLSYMNELAGGPDRGFTRLVDSNLDWGQDLPRLSAWLREHHAEEPIDLVYTGTADPRYYGIRHHNLALGYFAEPALAPDDVPQSRYFVIGATAWQGATLAADSRDFWRSFLARNGATLEGKAGYSMFIYRLGERKLPPL
jgi:4-amino-4-deoxy-L-arabinose transferase-like glycosyltransferase